MRVWISHDVEANDTWFVDAPEKLPSKLRPTMMSIPVRNLDGLKRLVYDTEMNKQPCVVETDDWSYSTQRARHVEKEGLFA